MTETKFGYSHADGESVDCPECEKSRRRIPVELSTGPTTIGDIAMLLEQILDVQRSLLARLGTSSDSRSSIEVKTSTRGVDIASKAYDGSPTEGLVNASVDSYFEAMRQVQERLNGSTA